MKRKNKIMALLLALGMGASMMTACGGKSSGTDVTIDENGNLVAATEKARLQVWAYCDGDELTRNQLLVEAFNRKYADYNIEAEFTPKPSTSYETTMKPTLSGESSPDVFLAADTYYKQWATLGFMEPLNKYIDSESSALNMREEIDDMFSGAVGRYLYDVNTTTDNGPNANYYGLPKGTGACAIYYNKTYMENAGIEIISVYEKDLAEYNQTNGTSYASVAYDARNKVFNNRIPMNWEECATLATVLQSNPDNQDMGCEYGFLTSWWFNYGFSVGGNCVGYVPTTDDTYNDGYYTFTLMDATVNYKVKTGESVTVNNTTYDAGELVSYYDKFMLTDSLAAKCDVLPSQRYAFAEYLSLAAKKESTSYTGVKGVTDSFTEIIPYKVSGGQNAYETALKNNTNVVTSDNTYREVSVKSKGIAPNPNEFTTDGRAGYFQSGIVAMLVDVRACVSDFRVGMDDDWDVAPMLVYEGTDKDGNAVSGIQAAHSGSTAWCVWSGSTIKNTAYLFVKFASSTEGQQILADAGTIIMNNKTVAEAQIQKEISQGLKPMNAEIYISEAEYQTPGDWWFLSDGDWIDDWAAFINQKVRNEKQSVSDFFKSTEYKTTFTRLLQYTKKK